MLTRPTLLQMPSFDAAKDQVFKFNVEAGGAQVVANKLVVRNQVDNQIVYDTKEETFKYEHILPANTLTNGQYYNAVVTVFDKEGNESVPSLPIQFRCYSQPVIIFTNMPGSGVINNANYNFEFEYNQAEGERLSSYIVNLYDATKKLVASSGEKYVADGTPPQRLNYLFTGFVDGSAYYIEVEAKTINGAQVSSGLISFNVDYKQPDLFTLLELKNNCEDGYITISSNIVLIDGVAQPDPPRFIDGKEIDLTGKDSYVAWPQGYEINDDFVARAWFRGPNVNSNILTFSNANGQTIKVDFLKGYENVDAQDMKNYVRVSVSSIKNMEYNIVSNYVEASKALDFVVVPYSAETIVPILLAWVGITEDTSHPDVYTKLVQDCTNGLTAKNDIVDGKISIGIKHSSDNTGEPYVEEKILKDCIDWLYENEPPILTSGFDATVFSEEIQEGFKTIPDKEYYTVADTVKYGIILIKSESLLYHQYDGAIGRYAVWGTDKFYWVKGRWESIYGDFGNSILCNSITSAVYQRGVNDSTTANIQVSTEKLPSVGSSLDSINVNTIKFIKENETYWSLNTEFDQQKDKQAEAQMLIELPYSYVVGNEYILHLQRKNNLYQVHLDAKEAQ